MNAEQLLQMIDNASKRLTEEGVPEEERRLKIGKHCYQVLADYFGKGWNSKVNNITIESTR